MSSQSRTPRDGKRNILSRVFSKLRRPPRSNEPASTSAQACSSPRQAVDVTADGRSTAFGGEGQAGHHYHSPSSSQAPTIRVEDHSSHHHGDKYEITQHVHGTTNFMGSVLGATLGTNSVTTIEQAFFSSGNEAMLLWDTLPKQRDIGGQANEYLEGSREDTVEDVLAWFEDPKSEPSFFIQGVAGMGKSTLARHLTYRLHQIGRLAASVSLSALPPDSRSPGSVVRMVSREIGKTHPEAIPAILEAIKSCQAAPLVEEIERFLIGPMRLLGLSHPLAVMFDAVDEYEAHAALIKAISSLAPSSLPIKFILLGRSDPRDRGFNDGSIHLYPLQLVSIGVMELFLSKQLEDVHWERGRSPAPWRITKLAELANGLFIWATVVCSLLKKRLSRFSPNSILDSILDERRSLGDSEQLATLYHQAIVLLFPEADDQVLFREYLTATIALQEPLSTDEFSAFTDIPIHAIEGMATELKALQIRQPGDGGMVYPAGRIFHLSLLEYLHSTSTPSHLAFHISLFDSHSKLAEYCLMELPRFLPSPHCLSYLDRSPRERYAVIYLMTHLHHGTPFVQPGPAEEWECSLHCTLLLQASPELLQQWGDLFVKFLEPVPALEEGTEWDCHWGSNSQNAGREVEDLDGTESTDYHGGGVDEQGAAGQGEGNAEDRSVDIVDIGNQDASEEDWDHPTWLSQLLQGVARTLGEEYTPRTSFQTRCLEVAVRFRPNNVELWYELGWVYSHVADRSSSIEACDRAVKAFQNALRSADEPGQLDPGRFLCALATALDTRFTLVGKTEDLDRAIVLHRDGLAVHPRGHVNRGTSLNNLASSLAAYLQNIGSIGGGIDEVISLQREAVDLLPQGHENSGTYLRNLADYLISRYEMTATIADLEEAVRLGQELLALCPLGHPDRGQALYGLAWDLISQYEAIGGSEHLEEAIRLGRELLSVFPVGDVGHHLALDALAMALCPEQEHLDEALELIRASVSLTPTTSPRRWGVMMDLATILLCHYERSGELEELEEAISVCDEALTLCPPNHIWRPKLLALQAKLTAAQLSPSSSS